MRQFYGVLKSAEPCLAFFFVTGVSKFSYPSEHSELNNVNDITLHPDYATITGYTQEELEFHFDEHLQSAEEHLKISRETLVKQMSDWYNGFSWDGEQQVYYPFSTLKFLEEKNFSNYWLPSADKPILLMRQMQKYANIEIENTRANSYTLNKFSLDNLDLVPLCFQTGYLTIKTLDRLEDEMLLDYPNKEVRESMSQFLIGVNFNESKKQIEGWVETN